MIELQHDANTDDYRHELMLFLNEFGLEAPAILSMARRAAPVQYDPGEVILIQGKHNAWVYFLIRGQITISLETQGRIDVLGEREAVTLLGEISYFNQTPATATVEVAGNKPAIMLRLSYDDFTNVIDTYPVVKPVLARIGEMRVVSNYNGFISFNLFMDMIGWKRDRLAVNRAMFHYLEDTITSVLLPRMGDHSKVLDVGDGPGVICEIIYDHMPERLQTLFLQATHLEDAVLNPVIPYPSDFSRARYLKERFDAVVALQVFNHVAPQAVSDQLDLACSVLHNHGLLLVVRLRVLDIHYTDGMTESDLLYRHLGALVEQAWPGCLDNTSLVQVTFVDADFDPAMEWNAHLCDLAVQGRLELPDTLQGMERSLVQVLLEQARQRLFDPDALHFHWLAWQASDHGFTLETSEQLPEVGFFYQLYRCKKLRDKNAVRIFNV